VAASQQRAGYLPSTAHATVAVIHAGSVVYAREAMIAKTEALISDAPARGTRLSVFAAPSGTHP
jgi:hypothetical protein